MFFIIECAAGWSQTELAKQVNASREAIGKYERNEASPSVEIAKNIADVFEVSIDYLIGREAIAVFDSKTTQRLKDIEQLDDNDKKHIYALLDAFLRDAKTKKAYSS